MKTDHAINCPACHHSFPIETAFANQLRGNIEIELRSVYDARLVKDRETLTRTAQAEAVRIHAVKLAELESDLPTIKWTRGCATTEHNRYEHNAKQVRQTI